MAFGNHPRASVVGRRQMVDRSPDGEGVNRGDGAKQISTAWNAEGEPRNPGAGRNWLGVDDQRPGVIHHRGKRNR